MRVAGNADTGKLRPANGDLFQYVWGPDRTPSAVKVTSSDPEHPSGTYSYHTDAAGSVVAITNAQGSVVARYRYGAFGGVTHISGTQSWLAERNPLRYRAYYYDTATELYYLPARYYEPSTARFLSPDPAPPSAGDPLSLNAYTYCQGDPVNLEDPDGARHEAGSAGGGRAYYDEQQQAGLPRHTLPRRRRRSMVSPGGSRASDPRSPSPPWRRSSRGGGLPTAPTARPAFRGQR